MSGYSTSLSSSRPQDAPDKMDTLLEKYRQYLVGIKSRSNNTVRIYIDDLRPFQSFLHSTKHIPENMNRQLLRDYLAWLSTSARGAKGGYARVSVARKLIVLRSFYRFLVHQGVMTSNPVPRGRSFNIRVNKRLPIFLDQRDMDRLLEPTGATSKYPDRDQAILEILYSSGIRLSELVTLDIKDINLETKEIKVWGKGSKERMVLIGSTACHSIRQYLNTDRVTLIKQPTPALFLNRYGDRLSRRTIENIVSNKAAIATIKPGVHTHTIRHTFATHLLEGGADLRVVQELLGHSSPATTQLYTHVTQSQARKVYMSSHPKARHNTRGKIQRHDNNSNS